MIFDCDHVTDLVLEWQETQDNVVLGEILQDSRPLVEAIVSTFDSSYRDDLIQESFLKMHSALIQFDPDISNLYNFLATVIRNLCITYVKKQGSHELEELGVDDYVEYYVDDDDADVLEELTCRNRIRFPSLPVSEIDDMTEVIYSSLSLDGKRSSGVISEIVSNFDVDRKIAAVIYHSTLIYLRGKLKSHVGTHRVTTDEFSIERDLEELVGNDAYSRIVLLFHGMYIRVS